MADTPFAPPLPSASVDFNAIHAAARHGQDLDKAVAEATFTHPEKAEAAKTGGVEPAVDTPVAQPKPAPETKAAKAASKES